MARDDSTGPLIAAAVTLTAVLMSPRLRSTLRGAAVQGLAGVLAAGDGVVSFAQGVSRGMRDPGVSPEDGVAPDQQRPAPGGEVSKPRAVAGAASGRKRRSRARTSTAGESNTAGESKAKPPAAAGARRTADE